MRKFKEQTIELLAPAGNFEIFKSIVNSRCDAIYFGGQILNMRLIRKGYNFSDDELREAVIIAREKGKKTYITVNNLIETDELPQAREYLQMLAELAPDGIIVQDFAIVKMVRDMKLPLKMHASVMMNVSNLKMLEAVKEAGINRVVMSRNNTLAEIKWIKKHIDIEIEYFAHGDMCIAHGAQCYYSSMLFGMSSNRGRCLKPCRWWFSPQADHNKREFPLAVKDMCMYQYLPEMIDAGVNSFKIEGRMREKDFITKLVNIYGDALDRYIENPMEFDRNKDYNLIYESRKRDLSTACAFGNAGKENINTRWEGTGKFYSTGKMFSTPTREKNITPEETETLRKRLQPRSVKKTKKTRKVCLSVKVNNIHQAKAVIDEGIERLYISGDIFNPDAPVRSDDVKMLKKYILCSPYPRTELYLGTPRMMNEPQFDTLSAELDKVESSIDGLLIGNLGAARAFKNRGLPMTGDYGMNLFNGLAAEFYESSGLSQMTASIELSAEQLTGLCNDCCSVELIAHGRLESMYFDHDFYKIFNHDLKKPLALYNEAGEYQIYMDQNGRTHLLSNHHFTALSLMKELYALGIAMFRIEGQTDTPATLKRIVRAFKTDDTDAIYKDELMKTHSYSYSALRFH